MVHAVQSKSGAKSGAKSTTKATQDKRQPGASGFLIIGDSEVLKDLKVPSGARIQPLKAAAVKAALAERVVLSKPRLASLKLTAYKPDAKALALLEGVRTSERILAEAGGAYELKEVILLLNNISRQAVDRRVQDRSILAVPGPGNRRWYPTLQFTDDRQIVDGLKQVLEALPTDNPWVAMSFLAQANDQLNGEAPISLLKKGLVDNVVRAAQALAEQGA